MTVAAPRLSVVVCTRNRTHRLAPCLDRIAESGRRASVVWELVVVDNGSTDDTSSAVKAWSADRGIEVNQVTEPRPGLSSARNRGVAAARGDLMAFVDDDCLVALDWVSAVISAYETPPSPDLVGGRVDLWHEADARVAIRPFADMVEIRDFSSICERLIGCNFSVRSDALRRVGPFDERLGVGTASGAAEDFDLFYRFLLSGLALRYDPRVLAYHAHGRREPRDLEALSRRYARGRGALYAKHALRDRNLLRCWYWELMDGSSVRFKSDLMMGALVYLREFVSGRLRRRAT